MFPQASQVNDQVVAVAFGLYDPAVEVGTDSTGMVGRGTRRSRVGAERAAPPSAAAIGAAATGAGAAISTSLATWSWPVARRWRAPERI
jgi:hypothetical protein